MQRPQSSAQAPSPLRNLVPEEDRNTFDADYHTEAAQAVMKVLSSYIENLIEGHTASADAHDQYDKASWPYMQADSVGFRRALRNLKKVVLPRDKNDPKL